MVVQLATLENKNLKLKICKLFLRYSSCKREPGYDTPASVEEIYFGTSSRPSNGYQPIYEDEVSYAAPISIYSPFSGMSL